MSLSLISRRAPALLLIGLVGAMSVVPRRQLAQSSPSDSTSGPFAARSVLSSTSPEECLFIMKNRYLHASGTVTQLRFEKATADSTLRRMQRSADSVRAADAGRCVARFTTPGVADTLAAEAFGVLYALYLDAGMKRQGDAMVAKRTAAAQTAEQKALTLYGVVTRGVQGSSVTRDSVAVFEGYLAQLDAMGPEFSDMQAPAHNAIASMFVPYFDHPIASKHITHAYDIVQRMTPRQLNLVRARGALFTSAYNASTLAAGHGDFTKAREILLEAIGSISLWNGVPPAESNFLIRMLARNARVFSLVGKKAPAIEAEYWYNVPAGVKSHAYAGNVTLIEVTSTSCGSCRTGYPAINRLYERYKGRNFSPLFVTTIEGANLGKPATVPEELEYDRTYWLDHAEIKFPLAIYDTKEDDSARGRVLPQVYVDYLFAGPPMFLIVDKKGVIRYTQNGHCENLEEKFAKIIETLAAE